MRLRFSVAFMLLPVAALAQTDTAHHGAEDIWAALLPYVIAGLGAFLTALLGLLTQALVRLNQKWAADILQANTDRIGKALTNAAGGLVQKLGAQAAMDLDAKHPEATSAAAEVMARVGPLLMQSGITPDSVAQRILEKVPALVATPATAIVVAGPAGEQGPPGPQGAKGAQGNPAPLKSVS